jgi:D-glycero-alpha-D-manno-heptose 1-phosphate guanylyltransferase
MTVAVILAGGMGTRIRKLVPDMPKPMASVSGRPFIEYIMDYWITQGVEQFILSVGYKKEKIKTYFGSSYNGIPLKYSEETEPLGTGGGVLLASKELDKPFILLNGDTLFKVDLESLKKYHNLRDSDLTIALFRLNELNRYSSINIKEDGQIVSFNNAEDEIGSLANGGVYYINPNIIQKNKFLMGVSYSLETQIIPKLMADGESLYGLEYDEVFIDIGMPKDYLLAQQIVK